MRLGCDPVDMDNPARSMVRDERWGVLHPENLARYGAQLTLPDPSIADVVDHFWHVRWNLNHAEVIPQRIIATPAVTFTVEAGDVPAPLVVTGVYGRAWERSISGRGDVFAIRLRPAGLAVLSDLTPGQIADQTLALTIELDARAFATVQHVASGASIDERMGLTTDAVRARLAERPPTARQLLANEVVGAIGGGLPLPSASPRTIQRALDETLGHGPKWVARWIRLQEVARLLSAPDGPSTAEIAAILGFTDQAHLVNDFRDAVGVTPGAYLRSLRLLSA